MERNLYAFTRYVMAVLAVMILGLGTQEVLAQARSISGIIKDESQSPLPGVSVVEKGTTNGTVTDVEGKFTLSVQNDAVLVISFIGMRPREVAVGTQTTFDIVMENDITELGEIVVVGYGEMERKDITTSISSVNARQLKDIPINSAAQALAGRLAGVQVTATEGSPNAEVTIRVRGGGSITQDNSPLYVVDGIQVENALNVLSPQDIESIDVLKDASATAIYGARGANGVVIITTKGGKEMKTVVSYNGLVGVRQLANKLDVWKPYDFVMYQYERSRGSSQAQNEFASNYGQYDDLELYKQVPFVDWQDKVFGRDAIMQTHNISVAGGSKVTQFNLSVTSNKEEGIMIGSDFDRKLVNFRFDHTISKLVKAGFNVRYNNTVVNGAGTSTDGSSSVNRLRHSIKYRPFLSIGQGVDSYDPDYALETNANGLSLVNPVLLSAAEYKKDTKNTANLNGYVSFNLTDYLTFRSTLGFDITSGKVNIFNDTITNASRSVDRKPIASIRTQTQNILNNSNVLTFNISKLSDSFAKRNKLDLLLGHEIFETRSREDFLESRAFPVGITAERALGNMRLGEAPQLPFSEELKSTLVSFFSRLNYGYDDRYLLTMSMRADGSSKFSKENKWGYFPAASLAWRVSSERFMQSFSSKLSDLKLRLSYGTSGNNRIRDFLYLSQFTPSAFTALNNAQVIGFAPAALANENLKWEAIISRNIGIDAGFFNNRLQVSVDLYTNSSKDLLLDMPVPTTSGYTSQLQNIGETSNRGVEIQLSGIPVDRGDFTWNANFNISYNRNTVENLGPIQSFLYRSGWAGSNVPFDYTLQVGRPVGTIWGLETDGYYTVDDFDYNASTDMYTLKAGVPSNQKITSVVPQPGVLKFKDVTGNGEVDDADRKVIGDATPKFFGGLNQQFAYKNFDLSVFINFQYGNDVLNANKLEFTSGYTVNSNLLTTMNGRWRNVDAEGQVVRDPEALKALNANATLWSPLTSASSFYVHSWAIEDGSFIRINNVTLGYSLPSSLISKAGMSKFRIYGTVNNLAVFSNYSGYDPEVNTRRNTRVTPGVDYAAYPRSHGYILGVNVSF